MNIRDIIKLLNDIKNQGLSDNGAEDWLKDLDQRIDKALSTLDPGAIMAIYGHSPGEPGMPWCMGNATITPLNPVAKKADQCREKRLDIAVALLAANLDDLEIEKALYIADLIIEKHQSRNNHD